MTTFKIKYLNNSEKPRERLIKKGADALSDSELLAIILRAGGLRNSALELANQILIQFGGLKKIIDADISQLMKIKNIGVAKAASIKALCEIALRINLENTSEKIQVNSPKDINKILKKELYGKTKEHLYLLSLDARNHLISKDLISIGTINETLIHPREIFRQAFSRNAVYVILAHNHPSGKSDPSIEDISVTEKIAKAGIELGIPLLDHLIICDDNFTSLKASNLFSPRKFNEKGGD